jgi:hypothetical protein
VFCDASVHTLPPDAPEKALRALVTRSGGELVPIPVLLSPPTKDAPLHLDCVRRGAAGDGPPAAKQPTDPAVLRPLRDAVDAKSRDAELAKRRFEAGTVSKIEVAAAEAELAGARARLAEAEGDAAAVVRHLDGVVKQRQEERNLIAFRVELGRDPPEVLNQADARLADAKARLARVKPPAAPEDAPAPRRKP